MTTAILLPVMRAHLLEALAANIASATPEPHELYWACTYGSECADLLSAREDTTVLLDEGASWGQRLNDLFSVVDEPYAFLGADDVLFHEGWLEAALKVMYEVEGVVAVNDLYNPRGTLALVSRYYIEEQSGCMDVPGVVIFPGYGHLWSETELFETAHRRGRFAYCAESVVEHRHPAAGKAEHDEVYALGDTHYAKDKALYQSRCHLWT